MQVCRLLYPRARLPRYVQCSLLTLAAALLLQMPAFAASSVWKVSKGADAVYLGGTIHMLPTSAFPLPAEFEQAYQLADVVVLEAKLPDPTDQQAAGAMIAKLSYPEGVKLSQKLTPQLWQALDEYLKTFKLTAQQFDRFKPGFVVLQMAMLELHQANMAGAGVDAYFAAKASTDQKPQHYLETIEFQLEVMAKMGQGVENQFVQANLKRANETAELLRRAIAAWRVGDVDALERILLLDAKADDPVAFDLLFNQRNHAWLPKIQQLFGNQQQEFILVGAGHLPGNDGLLQLLRAAGYQVQPLTVTASK